MQTEVEISRITYTVKEAVTVTGLGKSNIYNMINTGRLKSKRVGGRRMIAADSLRSLMLDA